MGDLLTPIASTTEKGITRYATSGETASSTAVQGSDFRIDEIENFRRNIISLEKFQSIFSASNVRTFVSGSGAGVFQFRDGRYVGLAQMTTGSTSTGIASILFDDSV